MMQIEVSSILREPRVTILSRPAFTAPEHLPTSWKGESTDGERLVEFAGRISAMSLANPAERETREYLASVRNRANLSPLEHAHYTLLLEGVSQSLAHSLVRDQPGFAVSELSQRHVDDRSIRYVMPPAIIGDAQLEASWAAQMEVAHRSYVEMVEAVMTRYAWIGDKVQRRRIAREAAAGVLPRSAESSLVMSGGARTWRDMLDTNTKETDLEFRRLAVAVLHALRAEAPALFDGFEIVRAGDRHEALRVRLPAG